MSYSRRFIIASILSVALHVFMLWLGNRAAVAKPKLTYEEAKSIPLTFNLEPNVVPEPIPNKPVKRLILTPIPTTEEIEDTDLISDNDSKAQDETDVEGERPAPFVEEPDDHDRIEQAPAEERQEIPEQMKFAEVPESNSEPEIQETVTEPQDTVEPVESIEELQEEIKPDPTQNTPTFIEVVDTTEMTSEDDNSEDNPDGKVEEHESTEKAEEEVEETSPEEQEEPERYQVAQVQPQPPQPKVSHEENLTASRGRSGGRALQSGVMNFEAKSHELGEYMLEVRKRVERQWHAAIQLQYLGVKRAEAVIVCVIRPSGIIEEVRIEDAGSSMPFAILCRDSIQNAGPFQKLPFDVPEIYRSENIEIRWRFSYL